ncbi:MAG: hypothetical protein LBE89_06080 [Helicobacteraceae bacterium]|jgi:hypothetical protein|nr:hypothetical protein [Helicobacteraceae bacterium]
MKKLKIAALLTALALFGIGCGEGGASSGTTIGGKTGVSVGQDGFTDTTKFVDEDGDQVGSIGDITSDGTGDTPPTAPGFVRPENIPLPPVPPAS